MSASEQDATELPEEETVDRTPDSDVPEDASDQIQNYLNDEEGEEEEEDEEEESEQGEEGEEGEEVPEEQEEEEDEESVLTVYDPDDYISYPKLSENSDMDLKILEFDFSYGYNCRKNYNLTVLDSENVAFISGNYLNFFNMSTKKIWFKRSALGGGLGHITFNPNPEYPHLAVAENGDEPIIIIYEWPSMDINAVLREGSSKLYSHLNYSPTGMLLVSQGGEPDYLITVWNWLHHKILLRTKSTINDVYRVLFSPFVDGQLTTCGAAHIKFWKMATTFTGLKLKGELGRFGKTEYSDILGILPMPDEKVISGCEWGNILIWEEGLIKLEVYRPQRRTCHDAPIVRMFYIDGELWTVSKDGHIKVWWYDKIDQADPPDDDRVVLVDPVFDLYSEDLMLMDVQSRFPQEPYVTEIIAQDGNGGIWTMNLSSEADVKPTTKLLNCHGNWIVGLATYTYAPYLISFGNDGKLIVYNYEHRKQIFSYKFPAKGGAMALIPPSIHAHNDEIIAGFDDGQIRAFILNFPETKHEEVTLTLVQVIKPHSKPITVVSHNENGNIFVSGAEDKRLFVFVMRTSLESNNFVIQLDPIGFIDLPDIPTYITWKLTANNTVLVGCKHGHLLECNLPRTQQDYTTVSYKLNLEPILNRFVSYKSQIRRNIKLAEIEARKQEKIKRKRIEMEKLKKDNPALEVDEELFLADSESEEELEPLYIPPIPNDIRWAKYTEDDTILLSIGGFDSGYFYEYKIDQKGPAPINFKMVDDADEVEINSILFTEKKEYIVFGMGEGSIRLTKVNPTDPWDFSNYWTFTMHDNLNGWISCLCFSQDEKLLFTGGHDGNIFAMKFRPKGYTKPFSPPFAPPKRKHSVKTVIDSDKDGSYSKLSLEETMLKLEEDRIARDANKKKADLRETLKVLKDKYESLLERNSKLLPSQIIPREELEIDKRVTEYLDKTLEENLHLVKRKMEYDVAKSAVKMEKLMKYYVEPLDFVPLTLKGINLEAHVTTLRQRSLTDEYFEQCDLCDKKILEDEGKGRKPERVGVVVQEMTVERKEPPAQLEYFLMSLSPSVIEYKLGAKLGRILSKYRRRRRKWERRAAEWNEFLAKKPKPGVNAPEDELELERAKATIGAYDLKTSATFKVPAHLRDTTVKKYKELLEARKRQYHIRHEFSKSVYELRDEKYKTLERLRSYRKTLEQIWKEIPKNLCKPMVEIPEDDPLEYPEKQFKIDLTISEDEEEDKEEGAEKKEIVRNPSLLEMEKMLLSAKREFPKLGSGSYFETNDVASKAIPETDMQVLINGDHEGQTPYEEEIKAGRLNRYLFTQDFTLKTVETDIRKFNDKLSDLVKHRTSVVAEGNCIDLHILVLHQELIILKSYESLENKFTETVNEKTSQVNDMQSFVNDLVTKVSLKNKEIEEMRIESKVIQDRFLQSVKDNKFIEFLKRVFNKKFTPPKSKTDEDSSESSSSSSSEDSGDVFDDESIDSTNFAIMKQDTNTCPKGCELAIFDLTVELRTQRHHLEILEKEEGKKLELIKKELEIAQKRLRQLQNNLDSSQRELEKYQQEKQYALNQVLCTATLRYSQYQNLDENGSGVPIQESLIFSTQKLSSLFKRVSSLQKDNYYEIQKYEVLLKHYTRMKRDLEFMGKKVQQLSRDVAAQMKLKFGKEVDFHEILLAVVRRVFLKNDVNDMEEVYIKQLVFDLRMKLADVRGLFKDELMLWKKKVTFAQKEMINVLKVNTAKMELLRLLQVEKRRILEFEDHKESFQQRIAKFEKLNEIDKIELDKLKDIYKTQKEQIEDLKNEIKMLKTKGLSLHPQIERFPAEKEEECAEDSISWSEFDFPMTKEEVHEVKQEVTFEELEEAEPAFPSHFSFKIEDNVKEIINELMLKLDEECFRYSFSLAEKVSSYIGKYSSAEEIVKDILAELPFKTPEEKMIYVRESGAKLLSLQNSEISNTDILSCAKDLLEDLLDEVLLLEGEPQAVIKDMVKKLVDNIPKEYLISLTSMDYITSRVFPIVKSLDPEELMKSMAEEQEDAQQVLNTILQNVFKSGIDYMYVIK